MFNHSASAASYANVMPTGALLTRACAAQALRPELKDDDLSAVAGCLDATPVLPAGGWFAVRAGRPALGAALFVNRD